LNTSNLEDDTICILTALNAIKMPAYCCMCRQTPADYKSLHRFLQNTERLCF